MPFSNPSSIGNLDGIDAATETARRMLNLFFVFNTSKNPLTTQQIISDEELGYGSPNPDSDKRKFNRDRKRLEEHGIYIHEVKTPGSSEREEGRWAIDRERTHADVGLISVDDADVLAGAIDAYLQRNDVPFRLALERIRSSVATLPGSRSLPSTASASNPDPTLSALWSSFSTRKSITIDYVDASGKETRRTVSIYGIYTLDGRVYITGYDDASNDIRTFRADRVQRAHRPRGSYSIPDSFNAIDYLFLPLDAAQSEGQAVTFSFPSSTDRSEIASITHGRGALNAPRYGADWLWTISARNIDAAASMALSHADTGMIPVAPQELVDAYRSTIRKALVAHEAR